MTVDRQTVEDIISNLNSIQVTEQVHDVDLAAAAKALHALRTERDSLEAENRKLREELGQLDASLDERMAALGMVPLDKLLSEPPTPFSVHVGVTDINSFREWVEKKHRSFLKMRMQYETGELPKDDDMFEWVFAHSAVFGGIHNHLRAALAEQEQTDDQ